MEDGKAVYSPNFELDTFKNTVNKTKVMEDISLINSGGIGDQLLAFQITDLLQKIHNKKVKLYCSCRDEIFNVLGYLFKDKFQIEQIPENLADEIVNSELKYQLFTNEHADETYIIYPDLLYRHKNSFDYKKYNLSLETIRDHKLLFEQYKPENVIYCALNTSTEQYKYSQKWELIKEIAIKNPEYIVHYNCIDSWNGQQLNTFIPDILPKNCRILKNNSFENEIEVMRKSCYAISIDNGPSHILQSCFGVPLTLLDTRMNMDGLMWIVRWRENIGHSIGYHYDPKNIAELVKTNIEIPATQLLTRSVVINNLELDWKRQLNFKY